MLKLGENIKKFRASRELTQEQLAGILGVSAQAVSRWENGAAYPDITLLPAIAGYFEITLDELMGMNDFKSEEQLKELLAKLDENGNKGLIYENILLLREAVKAYPTNYELQFRLVNQLTFCQYKDGKGLSEDEINDLNREAVEVGNRILSRCSNGEIINHTTHQLAYIYSRLGETEKAIEFANRLPALGACSTVILGDIYEGEQQKKHLQHAVKAYISTLWCDLINMADLEYKDETMTTAERIAIMKKALALLEIVYEDGDYLDYSDTVSITHRYIAAMAMLENDHELALSSLEKAAEFAIMSDTLPEKAQHTSLLVNKTYYDAHKMMKNFDFTRCKELYDKMQWDRYDAIRDDKRFTAILEKIKKYC
ncbi:MAG: helix-turn-helix transcriptional regulator [Oscillospiraceae bacterium]|nr:helix-turn-helix transcriptional regulator [Oscillospiraceae bacterium]